MNHKSGSERAALVHGIHAVAAVVEDDPGRVRAVYLQRGRHDDRLQAVIDAARAARIRVEVVDRRRLDRLTGGSHQGIAVDCHELRLADEKAFEARFLELATPRLLLVLDGVTDPRNLGACLRSAEAAGVQAVLLPKRRSAPLNAAALKAAAGGAEALFLVQVSNLARRLEWLRDQGVWVIGAAGEGGSAWLESDFSGDAALVMGSEGKGMRALTAKCCDQLVRIPMAGAVSSLNVSVATGIMLFEARRQRGLASG
ncbi:MAG: 23S rRNA (guanosine(2251)-2'-O)-methyltransferase RlmB [Gammaproteobacteria bacterium]|nr:23S rRNA (guanosine(2251)-2'-O)-methyltransferase RlmB [Gammaproteobacteria bacterium]